jgi:hypothetical protein
MILQLESKNNHRTFSVVILLSNGEELESKPYSPKSAYKMQNWVKSNTDENFHDMLLVKLEECLNLAKQRRNLLRHLSKEQRKKQNLSVSESGWLR